MPFLSLHGTGQGGALGRGAGCCCSGSRQGPRGRGLGAIGGGAGQQWRRRKGPTEHCGPCSLRARIRAELTIGHFTPCRVVRAVDSVGSCSSHYFLHWRTKLRAKLGMAALAVHAPAALNQLVFSFPIEFFKLESRAWLLGSKRTRRTCLLARPWGLMCGRVPYVARNTTGTRVCDGPR